MTFLHSFQSSSKQYLKFSFITLKKKITKVIHTSYTKAKRIYWKHPFIPKADHPALKEPPPSSQHLAIHALTLGYISV